MNQNDELQQLISEGRVLISEYPAWDYYVLITDFDAQVFLNELTRKQKGHTYITGSRKYYKIPGKT